MPVPENIREAKSILSERLLQPPVFGSIHGVGTGMITANDYHLRIYVTNLKARGLTEAIKKALGLKSVPKLPSFVLGDDFTNQFLDPVRKRLEGMIVDLVEAPFAVLAGVQGPVLPSDHLPPAGKACQVNQLVSPVPAGASVWRSSTPTVQGTIGYFCTDNTSPAVTYLLTCNHVIVSTAENTTGIPSSSAVSRETGSIATLSEFIPVKIAPLNTAWNSGFNNTVDAAIAKMNLTADLRITGTGAGTARDKISPTVISFGQLTAGWEVKKHGRKTCVTKGMIQDAVCDFRVFDSVGKERLFVDQFMITARNERNQVVPFADLGDSGSLVYKVGPGTSSPFQAAGLLIATGDKLAGSNRFNGTIQNGDPYTLANSIDLVLNLLTAKINVARAKAGKPPINLVLK